MKQDLQIELGSTLRTWVATSIEESRPRLCCEIERTSFKEAVNIICSALKNWSCECFLLIGAIADKDQFVLADVTSTLAIIRLMMENEGTLSVVDVGRGGGCTFDLSECDGDDDEYDFLAVAWGAHEVDVKEIAKTQNDAVIFRGN